MKDLLKTDSQSSFKLERSPQAPMDKIENVLSVEAFQPDHEEFFPSLSELTA